MPHHVFPDTLKENLMQLELGGPGAHSTITNSLCPRAGRRDKLSPLVGSLLLSLGPCEGRDLVQPPGVWMTET